MDTAFSADEAAQIVTSTVSAAVVEVEGSVYEDVHVVDAEHNAVRPALWIEP